MRPVLCASSAGGVCLMLMYGEASRRQGRGQQHMRLKTNLLDEKVVENCTDVPVHMEKSKEKRVFLLSILLQVIIYSRSF